MKTIMAAPSFQVTDICDMRRSASVSVFYNPANPAAAMLEPLNFENAKVALIAAIGFAGCGLLAPPADILR
jgi:hypothetical protein